MTEPILRVKDLRKYYPLKKPLLSFLKGNDGAYVKAVDGVSFQVEAGDSIAIVGESGCGKTTTAKTILGLTEPTSGEVEFEGRNIFSLSAGEMRRLRKHIQVVYQDPYEALNPKQRIVDILLEPLIATRTRASHERQARVRQVLEEVGLTPVDNFLERFPHELSGGQRQRVAIAAALTVEPKLVIADEPVSMLDISKRLDVIQLLNRLKRDHNLTLVTITHDLPIARYLTNWVMVMYLGKIVEYGATDEVLQHPTHPYTQALVSVTKVAERYDKSPRMVLEGESPNPANVPSGCRFHTRCPMKEKVCVENEPETVSVVQGHTVACHFASQIYAKFREVSVVE